MTGLGASLTMTRFGWLGFRGLRIERLYGRSLGRLKCAVLRDDAVQSFHDLIYCVRLLLRFAQSEFAGYGAALVIGLDDYGGVGQGGFIDLD
jgi:hypothetical protein